MPAIRKLPTLRWIAWTFVLAFVPPHEIAYPAPADASATLSPAIRTLDVGVGGHRKVGHWTPVHLVVETASLRPGDQIELSTADPDGCLLRFVADPITWTNETPEPGLSSSTLLAKFGYAGAGLEVAWRRADGTPVERRQWQSTQISEPSATDELFVVGIGQDCGLAAVVDQRNRKSAAAPIRYVQLSPDQLPSNVLEYDAIDIVVVASNTAEALQQNPDAVAALSAWVEQGGQLLLFGSGDATILQPETGCLRGLLPGPITGVTRIRQTTGLEQYAAANVRIDRGSGVQFELPMAELESPRGRVLAWEGLGADQTPAVVRSTQGLGQVVFLAAAPEREPLASWQDRDKLMDRLFELALDDGEYEEAYRSEIGPVAHVGFTDLVGQLRTSMDQFPNVKLVPFSWVATLAVLYILLMGPVDYWLLKRWGRPEWTWVTFLLTVGLFTGTAFFLATYWKGYQALVNQVTVVDADLVTGVSRGTTWAHLYSPRTQRVDVASAPTFGVVAAKGQVTAWQGLPGDGFGGLNREETPSLFDDAYQCNLSLSAPSAADESTDISMSQLPITVWSSRSVSAKWWGQNDWRTAHSNTELKATPDGRLSGTIVNPWPVELTNAMVLNERWVYKLGSIAANGSVPIDVSLGSDLQTLLTDRKVVKGRNVVTPWDREDTDWKRIMQLLLFYDAAKGRAYTQLKHRYQDELDWSHHLSNGQVILWAECAEPGTQLQINDRAVPPNQSLTICRLLIPLNQHETR